MVPAVSGAGVEPWSSAPLALPVPLEFDAVIDDQDALIEALIRLRGSGWTQLDGVPSGTEAVEAFASRIGYVRRTIFGDVWELAADLTDHADTAYGTTALGPHTDGAYSHDGPGLQLFACQDRRGDGGESILVDGFAAAELFAAPRPGWRSTPRIARRALSLCRARRLAASGTTGAAFAIRPVDSFS